jgi:hypothetical protein
MTGAAAAGASQRACAPPPPHANLGARSLAEPGRGGPRHGRSAGAWLRAGGRGTFEQRRRRPGSCEVVLRDADARRPAGGDGSRRARPGVPRRCGAGMGASQAREAASALGQVGSAGLPTARRCSAAEAFATAWRLTGLAPARSCCRSSSRCSCSARRGWRRCPSSWASSRPGCITSTAITRRTRYSAPRSP